MENDIRDLLAQAERARGLARACDHTIVGSILNRYAAELEAEAARLKDARDPWSPLVAN